MDFLSKREYDSNFNGQNALKMFFEILKAIVKLKNKINTSFKIWRRQAVRELENIWYKEENNILTKSPSNAFGYLFYVETVIHGT